MINKMEVMRKIKKNRILVLIISVIVVSGVYSSAKKAIDAYVFNNNSDIVFGSETLEEGEGKMADADGVWDDDKGKSDEKNWFEKLFGGNEEDVQETSEDENVGEKQGKSSSSDSEDVAGKISEDEVNLELEAKDEESGEGIEIDVSNVTDEFENSSRESR